MAYDVPRGGSWQAAYEAAPDGAVLTVEPGEHPAQTLSFTGRQGPVTFDAAGVVMPALESRGAQHVRVDGLRLTGRGLTLRLSTANQNVPQAQPTVDWVLTGLDVTTFLLRNVRDVTLRGCRVGGFDQSVQNYGVPKVGAYVSELGAPARLSSGVLIEDCFFHDVLRTVTGTSHAEGFYLDAGCDGVTLRRCSFTNCGVFDVFSNGQVAGRPITNILIEGCLLDVPRDQVGGAAASAINFKGGAGLVTLRGNSILGNVRRDSAFYDWRSERNAVCGSGGGPLDVVADIAEFVSARRDPCDLGACYRNDLRVRPGTPSALAGAGVLFDEQPPPPPPPPPPPADSLPLTVLASTASTVTLGWTPVDGCVGYRMRHSGTEKWSHTWDPARAQARFAAGQEWYRVEALMPGPAGSYRP